MTKWESISKDLILKNLNTEELDRLIETNVWAYELERKEITKRDAILNQLRDDRRQLSDDLKSVDKWMDERDKARDDFEKAMEVRKDNQKAEWIVNDPSNYNGYGYYSFLSYKQINMVLKNVKLGSTIEHKGYTFTITRLETKNFKNSQPLQVTLQLDISNRDLYLKNN